MPERKGKKMDEAITFVLSAEDKQCIKARAKSEGRSASNWVRRVIEAELRREEQTEAESKPTKNKTRHRLRRLTRL